MEKQLAVVGQLASRVTGTPIEVRLIEKIGVLRTLVPVNVTPPEARTGKSGRGWCPEMKVNYEVSSGGDLT